MMKTETKKELKWYVVRVAANREKSTMERIKNDVSKGNLDSKITNVVVPIEKTYFMKEGKKVAKEKIIYPGYVFVETNILGELKHFIKDISGVTGMLTTRSGDIQPLKKSEVDYMIGTYETEKEKADVIPFIIGEEVTVCDGPFNGFKGVIEEINEKLQKVKVNVLIFGRKTGVDLSTFQIMK